MFINDAKQITKCVALACSRGPEISRHISKFIFPMSYPIKRFTLKHTNVVLDDQKCFEFHGFRRKSMYIIYSNTEYNIVTGYLMSFRIVAMIRNGLDILMKINPEITPAKCPKNEA